MSRERMARAGKILVIGVGNDYRRDDATGPVTARKLRALVSADVRVCDSVPDGLNLIDLWDGAGYVIVIDCMVSGASPGTIRRFDALHEDLPAAIFPSISTHLINIPEAITLSRTLNKLPSTLLVYGIEAGDLNHGIGLTPPVEKSVNLLAAVIAQELHQLTHSAVQPAHISL